MTKALFATTVPITLRAFLLPFADHFRAKGWQVDALANGAADCEVCADHFDRLWDAAWSRSPLAPANLIGTPRWVRELVRREGYDLVHVHTPVAAFVTRYALRGSTPLIYTAHGFHFHERGSRLRNAVFRSLERVGAQWTDTLIVINHEDEAAALRMLPADRVAYVPGIGVDTAHYNPDEVSPEAPRQLRRSLGLTEADVLFAMVAEFIPRKRHVDALHALAAVPGVHIAFAGEGALMDDMRALAVELGINGRAHFLGFQDDVRPLMCACRALMLPSEQEGLPRSIMEAMSLGTPVIATDIRGTRDLLTEGTGILVPPHSPDQVAGAMRMLTEHPDRAAAMGKAARQRIREGFTLQHVIDLHERIYAAVLS